MHQRSQLERDVFRARQERQIRQHAVREFRIDTGMAGGPIFEDVRATETVGQLRERVARRLREMEASDRFKEKQQKLEDYYKGGGT